MAVKEEAMQHGISFSPTGPAEPVRLVRPKPDHFFVLYSVMIVSLTNMICMNVVMIATITQASYSTSSIFYCQIQQQLDYVSLQATANSLSVGLLLTNQGISASQVSFRKAKPVCMCVRK